MTWPAPADRPLVEIMRGLPGPVAGAWRRALVERAENHGLADVVIDAWERMGVPADEAVVRHARARRIARELDHAAHLTILRRIDAAFSAAGLRAVALKGVLFAERYYERPAFRGTTDVDLMVREADLDVATRVLAEVGYHASEAESELRFRREHHHLHFHHAHAAELELHFHAYRGFGAVLRSDDLIARSVAAPTGFEALRVLAPDDELVYLAVHAAAHRFGRLSWLYDLRLLVDAMSDGELANAAQRARELGFQGPLALAGRLLVDGCAIDERRIESLRGGARRRIALAATLAPEPASSVARSATRFVYSLLLCATPTMAARYATTASFSYARRIAGRGP